MNHFMIDHIFNHIHWNAWIIQKSMYFDQLYHIIIEAKCTFCAKSGGWIAKPGDKKVEFALKVALIELIVERFEVVCLAFCAHVLRICKMRVIKCGHVFIDVGLSCGRKYFIVASYVAS